MAAALLEATPQLRAQLDQSARIVCAMLEETPQWAKFAYLHEHLEEDARKELVATRNALRQRLKPDVVDAFEPNLAMPRNGYRETTMVEALQSLSGQAREYALAFDSIDTLIETAASDVFGQLASYGSPTKAAQIRDIDFEPGEPPLVHFTVDGEMFPDAGQLLWADDVFLPDAILVREVNFNFNEDTEAVIRMTGQILKGTSTAW